MLIRRIALFILSLAIGAILTALIVMYLLDTSLEEYGGLYFFLTAFFLAAAIGIWLDKFMGTDLLPE
ncbi:MAG: hypothetical protein R3272_05095 [Candidatus Promineifilaceae bacterium]|nr:hypothetical protein [Candidatus Promineifilaceae bacterium]